MLAAVDIDYCVKMIETPPKAGCPSSNAPCYEINILESDADMLAEFIVGGCWRGNKRFPIKTWKKGELSRSLSDNEGGARMEKEIEFFDGHCLSAGQMLDIYKQGLDDILSGKYPESATDRIYMAADMAQCGQLFLAWNLAILKINHSRSLSGVAFS